MAVSGKVYSKSDFSVGIKNKNATAFETAAANDTAYELLPVINVSAPVLNLVESGEIRSNNAGMIELDTDQFRTTKGGFITMDFEVPAERDMIVRMLANVLQDHGESGSGPYVHTIQATSGAALSRPDFTGSSSSGIPSLFDIGLYYPESAQDKLITSAVLQSSLELFAPLNPTVNFAVGEDFKAKRDAMRADLESRFFDLERYLNKYDGKYFVDDTPRAAEFACFHHLDLSKKLDPKLLDGFPRLMKFVEDIQSIDEVSKYMEKRPELIDVGIEPKLVIDGTAHPTGVNRT